MTRDLLPHIGQGLQRLKPTHKRLILRIVDGTTGAAAAVTAIRLVRGSDTGIDFVVALCALLLGVGLSVISGLDRTKLNTFMHTGVHRAACFASALAVAVGLFADLPNAASAGLLTALLGFAGVMLSRAALLHAMLWFLSFRQAAIRVLIYGAGKTGQQLSAALREHETIVPVAFLDDDPVLQGSSVAGLHIHQPAGIDALVRRHRIDRVLLAMPSLSAARQLRVSRGLYSSGLEVHALPSFAQLVGTEALHKQLAPLHPDEILGRTQLAWDLDQRAGAYRGRTVLVTGAGGSVGSELCRHLMGLGPRRLLLFEMSELALYNIHRELAAQPLAVEVELVPILGSVCDRQRVRAILADHAVDVVLHAAAYKHVPLVEANPLVGISNNVLGTRVLTEAAHDAMIERFILISTDKAVRPTNVMGASKRLAELVVQDTAKRPGRTAYSIVRFGNVLGSSGSVIPLFRAQIAAGGPVTLTHDDVTRYFMSLSEASQLVLLAGAMDPAGDAGQGGVYVLDMGAPLRIRDLAVQMVNTAGLTVRDPSHPEGDIEIKIVGLRPGEKLHEELLIGPGMITTPHPKVLRMTETSVPPFELAGALRALQVAINAGDADLARLVVDAVVRPRVVEGKVTQMPQAAQA